jgi:hypothetical protein
VVAHANQGVRDDGVGAQGWPTDWPMLYAQYLTRSANQAAKSLELYQEVMDCVARGELAPTVFQEMLTSFAQTRGGAYTDSLAKLGMRFFSGLVQVSTTYSNELAEILSPGFTIANPVPPQYNPANPIQWYQDLTSYANQLSSRAADMYKNLFERVASGEVQPNRLREVSANHLERQVPELLDRLSNLYFDLLNGLNDLRASYEEEYLSGILAAANRPGQEPAFVINLIAPPGEIASASLSLANTRMEPVVIRYIVTDVRRADGIGPAFRPNLTLTPDTLELQPGQEASVSLSLRLDQGEYEPQALYVGTLQIIRHGEPRLEVPLRITATTERVSN